MDFSFHASCMCIPSPHPELGSMFPQLGCNLTAQYNGWEWHPGTSEAWFLEALHLSPRLIGALTLEKVRGPTTLRPPYGEKHKPRGQTQDMPCGEKERPQRIGAPDIWMKRSFWNCVLQPQMPSCQCPGSEINHSVKIDPSQHGISGAFILQNHSSVVWGILTCLKQDAVLSVIHLT